MSEYIYPYWDDLDYWGEKPKKNKTLIDDDDLPSTVED
jgi:hypothetical protein